MKAITPKKIKQKPVRNKPPNKTSTASPLSIAVRKYAEQKPIVGDKIK